MPGENETIGESLINDILKGTEDESLANEDADLRNDELPGNDADEGDQADEHQNDQEGDQDGEGDQEGDDIGDDLDTEAVEDQNRHETPPKDPHDGKFAKDDPFDLNARVVQKNGNIFINGKLIAKAGREARLFFGFRALAKKDREASRRMADHVTKIAAGAQELFNRYEALKQSKGLLDAVGLTVEEQADVVPVIAAYKKDPIQGIKLLLTKAHLAGVDIKQITGATGGGLDAKALMDELKTALKAEIEPIRTATSARETQDREASEAKGFFQRNGDNAKAVARYVGGPRQLGLILSEAKKVSPDLSIDELFQRLHYQILLQHDGRVPTGPVDKRGKQGRRQQDRQRGNGAPRSSNKGSVNESFTDIANSVLRDIRLASSRGQ